MTYPIPLPADNAAAYTYTQPIRDSIAGVNNHQLRLIAVESSLTSVVKSAAYTLAVDDFDIPTKVREFVYQSTSPGSFTLPTGVPGGLSVLVHQFGTGQLTIAPGSGVTLNARGGAYKLAGQYAVGEVRSITPGTFLLIGDIIP